MRAVRVATTSGDQIVDFAAATELRVCVGGIWHTIAGQANVAAALEAMGTPLSNMELMARQTQQRIAGARR